MSTKTTKGVQPRKPRQRVYYRGNQYDLHPYSHEGGSLWHVENCFLWGILILVIVVVVVWAVSSFVGTTPHSHYVPVVVQAPASAPPPSGGDPFVFKMHGFAHKRSRRTECKAGEVWDKNVSMCAPHIRMPSCYDSAIVDGSTAPCQSFYQHMCGRWNAQHTNEDRCFSYGYYRGRHILEQIVKGADPNTDPIGKMYESCKTVDYHPSLVETRLEYAHIEASILGDFGAYEDIPVALARLARYGYTSPFSFSIEKHPLEPRMIPLLAWDGVPNCSLTTVTHVFESTRGITQHGSNVVLNKIDRAWKVIRSLNAHKSECPEEIHSYEEYIKTQFANDLIPFNRLPRWHCPYEDTNGWNRYFEVYGGFGLRFPREQTFWVIGRSYMNWLMEQGINRLEVMDWKAYIEFCILYNTHKFTPSLPSNVYFRQWDKHGPIGRAARIYHRIPRDPTPPALWDAHCVDIVRHLVPGLVAKAYLEQFPHKEQVRTEVTAILEQILAVYKESVQTTPWLPQPDRQMALDKIDAIIVRVAEPDDWHVEPFAEEIHKDRWDHNVNLVRRYRVQRNLELWHRDLPNRLDRSALAFFSTPLSGVNAYYSGSTNTITVLSGILQMPFYNVGFSNVAKHAIVGSVIAHELGHALDPHGVHWDKDGSYCPNGFWSQEAMRQMFKVLQGVIREFGPAPAGCNMTGVTYGNHTLGEDMADLGIRMAYKAYFEKTREGQNAPLADRQRFFMAFAQTWCSSYDQAHVCHSVEHDVHAVPEYRVDRTLANTPEFQQVFSCRADTALYRAPGKEVKVYGS